MLYVAESVGHGGSKVKFTGHPGAGDNYLVSVYKLRLSVIPVSEACPESFLKNDSGQAGMTEERQQFEFIHRLYLTGK